MTQQELEELIKDLQAFPKECEWVEFKTNNFKPDQIGEYISALSNGACYKKQLFGYLVFGIEDQTQRLTGTTFNPNTTKPNGQELENWLACHLTPRIDFNIFPFSLNGNDFVIFKIQAASQRPVTFKQESYIRIGSYKKKLGDHPEREKAIWSQSGNYSFEKEIAIYQITPNSVLEYIDHESVFKLLKIPNLTNTNSILDKLVQERILQRNGSNYDVTNLGAILFAKDLTLFEDISRKAIRVVFYDGNNKVKTIKEIVGKRGYATGFKGLISFMESQLPKNEVIEKALRTTVSEYPILAIRELVANALIHQDFGVNGSSPMIEVFSNRIEITNPGSPLIDPNRFVDHSPQSRNEKLARFMGRLNICEERGSGFDKVIFECEFHQLPAPEVVIGENYTRVVLYGLQSFKSMDKKDKIRSCFLHACLKQVSGQHMTNQSVRERFGIAESNYPMASRIIADTIEAGLIKDYDQFNTSKKYAKYVPYWV